MTAVMIGVDPHKGSHTAVAISTAEEPLGKLRVRASADQAGRLVQWAAKWPERTWAVEGAGGLGHLLAQQLVAAGELVLDVQPKLAARVRLLDAGDSSKNDPNDAASVAVAALRSRARRQVRADDHAEVLKVWSRRHRDLTLDLADNLLNLLPHRFQADPQRLQGLGRHALTLVDQAQQDVLGADVVVDPADNRPPRRPTRQRGLSRDHLPGWRGSHLFRCRRADRRDPRRRGDGYIDHLLARPVSRWRWMTGRLVVSAGLVIIVSLAAGLAGWAGIAGQHTGLSFAQFIKAGLNIGPPALFVLGAGVLAYGAWPRLAPTLAYGLVAWSFLIELLATVVTNRWLLDTSVLHHIQPVPVAQPNWTTAAWLTGLAILTALAGTALFSRRDLAGA